MIRSSLVLLAIGLECAVLSASDVPSSAPAIEPDVVRVFKHRALGSNQIMRQAALDAAMEPAARDELLQLLDEYARMIDAQAEQIRRDPPPLRELTQRARALQEEAYREHFAKWAKANRSAAQVIERDGNWAISVYLTLAEDRQQLVSAVIKAGLPEERRDEATRIVDNAHKTLMSYKDVYEKREQQARKLPPGEEKDMAQAAREADAQPFMFALGHSVYVDLRKLMQPDQYDAFERALPRPGW